jgi:hypothetical protein
MGLMMGPSSNGGKEQPVQVLPLPQPLPGNPIANTVQANPKSSQFGSRLFFGYKFNQYAGFEGGFSYFSGISYALKEPAGGCPANGGPCVPAAGTTARVRSIDFVGKLDYSYNNTIGLFGKGGVAAVYTTSPGALDITNYSVVGGQPKTSGSNKYNNKIAPTFTVGASYDLNQSWQIDMSWTRLFVGSAVSYMDMYALGLSVHFVDVYCGQFLCEA